MSTGRWVFVVVMALLIIALLALARGRPDGHRIGSLGYPYLIAATQVQ